MKQLTNVRTLAVVLFVIALLAVTGFAQTSKGTITGIITDASQAVVPGATVTASAENGGETRSVTTGPNGAYGVQALTPGEYTVTVTAKGFSATKVEHVEVKASTSTTANATLQVKSSGETITVEATAAQDLQTTSGELSHQIETAEIQNVPVNSLNPIELALTEPGVVSQASRDSFTNGVGFSVNGTRPRANGFLLDGFDNTDAGIGGQAFQPTNLGAVGEVVVLTNSYAAEYGHGGSVTNVTYKGGSNKFHGSAWELHQNSALNAMDPQSKIAGSPKAPSHENTFGFDLGGAVKKDKLFYYGTYQWDRYQTFANGNTFRLPDAAGIATLQGLATTNPNAQLLLNGLNGLVASTPAITCAVDPTSKNCIALGNGRPAVETNLVQRTGVSERSHDDQWNTRIDWLPTPKDTVTVRYLFDDSLLTPDFFTNASALPGYDTMQGGRTQNLGIQETHTFTANVINEFRFAFGRNNFGFNPTPATLANPASKGPAYSISGLFDFGLSSGYPQSTTHNSFQYQDAVNWTKGTHTLKFGTDLNRIYEFDDVPFNSRGELIFEPGGGYTALGNFIDNYTGQSGSISQVFGSPRVRPFVLTQAYYAQDSWRIKPNLTLNYGVRYEYAGNPENYLPYPALDITAGANQNPLTRVKVKKDANNWAPRIGIAYTPKFWTSLFGEDKTVIRAGYGMFYDSFFNNILLNTAASSPNVLGATITGPDGRGYDNATGRFASISPVYDPTAGVTSVANNLVAPLTHQWNLDIERALPGNFTLTTAYVGTRGEHLFVNDELNPENFDYATHLNPNLGFLRVRDNAGSSIYHGLNAKLDRRFSNGLLLRAAYTYSKMIDNGSEVFVTSGYSSLPQNLSNRASDRGLSAYDRRQRLVLTYVYSIPNLHVQNGFLNHAAEVIRNWQISGTTTFQTGAPETVVDGFDANGDGIASDRPSLSNAKAPISSFAYDGAQIGGIPGVLYDGQTFNRATDAADAYQVVSASQVHWIVPGALTAADRYGNVGRNSIITNGSQDWTFSVARSFPIPGREGQQLLFRTELFNQFNHANLGIPTYNLQSNDFADSAITAYGSRSIRFWLKYSF